MKILTSTRMILVSASVLAVAGLASSANAQTVYSPDPSEFGRYDTDSLAVGSGAWWRQMDREGRGGTGNS